jgi:23S rRNA (uracil1939-C5)-methyltransferase
LTVERLAPEGQGIARAEGGGRVVFLPHSAPGDRVRARIREERKGCAFGEIVEVLTPGPGRVEPACPLHFRPCGGACCGGCSWQHLSYESQLLGKAQMIEDGLRRIGRLGAARVDAVRPSPSQWRYRNKVLIPFGRGPGGEAVAGFFAPGSRRIVDFSDCPVQSGLSVRIALAVKRMGLEPYDAAAHSGWLRHLFIRTNLEGRALVSFVTLTEGFPGEEAAVSALRRDFPEITGIHQCVQPHRTSVVLGERWRRVWGEGWIEESVGGVRLRVSPQSFLQVNTPASEVLFGVVRDLVLLGGFRPELVLDLYCGAGAIALSLAPLCGKVFGVEENRRAVSDARANASLNSAFNARFAAGRVETSLALVRKALEPLPAGSACAVLDPPRAGCSEAVLKAVSCPAVDRIVYVSCNPATFARDACRLSKGGWSLGPARPVDLFPQTPHVECAALFRR